MTEAPKQAPAPAGRANTKKELPEHLKHTNTSGWSSNASTATSTLSRSSS